MRDLGSEEQRKKKETEHRKCFGVSLEVLRDIIMPYSRIGLTQQPYQVQVKHEYKRICQAQSFKKESKDL